MQSKWLLPCATPLLLPAALDRLPGGVGEAVRMGLLAEPAAALASLFCSGPLARDTLTGWPLLPGWAGTVRVTPDCAGLQFWSIALAVALFHVLPGLAGLARWRAAAVGVLASYALTLLLNASRILLVGVCLPLAQSWPDVLSGTLHVGIGVLVFLPGLIGFSWLLTRFRTLGPEAPAESSVPTPNLFPRWRLDSNSFRDPEDSAGASNPKNAKVGGVPFHASSAEIAHLPNAFAERSLSHISSRSPHHEPHPS